MNPFRSLRDYELYIYSLHERFSNLIRSTLTIVQRGTSYAEMSGELSFSNGCRLVLYERLSWDSGSLIIEGYSYEAWCANEKLYWYDSQSHPHDSSLASTDPHHKHVPPNIKRNRIPAPGISFVVPNLPYLINEIEQQK